MSKIGGLLETEFSWFNVNFRVFPEVQQATACVKTRICTWRLQKTTVRRRLRHVRRLMAPRYPHCLDAILRDCFPVKSEVRPLAFVGLPARLESPA